jgi:hypothetical protein
MNTWQNQRDKSGQRFVIFYLWKKNLEVKCIRADMKQAFGPMPAQRPKLHDECNASSKAMFHARKNRALEDRHSVWDQLSPDSSRRIHLQVNEFLQPASELPAIR